MVQPVPVLDVCPPRQEGDDSDPSPQGRKGGDRGTGSTPGRGEVVSLAEPVHPPTPPLAGPCSSAHPHYFLPAPQKGGHAGACQVRCRTQKSEHFLRFCCLAPPPLFFFLSAEI